MAKKVRVAVNGLGRIGRMLVREWCNRNIKEFDIVAVNNPGNRPEYVHLLNHDSIHGRFAQKAEVEGDTLSIGSKQIKFFGDRDPLDIPWENMEVDIVVDATGIFKTGADLGKHKRGSVKKVIMCAPGKELDGTFVMGINHDQYDNKNHHIISNASCTTNCLAPVAKVLNDSFGINSGFMTTVHAYTLDQRVLDTSHRDLRRARAAGLNMIPTTTGAAKAVGLVIPELKGKLDGYAIRVPTPDVSMVDLTVNLGKKASKEEISAAMKEASETYLQGVLAYNDLPLVSQDFIGDRHSSVYDSSLTNVIDKTAKVVAWYDNEVGFSNRVLDLTAFVGSQL